MSRLRDIQKAPSLGIGTQYLSTTFYDQNSAGQSFENAIQMLTHAAVFGETSCQSRIALFEFVLQPGYFCAQQAVRVFERTRGFGERTESLEKELLVRR